MHLSTGLSLMLALPAAFSLSAETAPAAPQPAATIPAPSPAPAPKAKPRVRFETTFGAFVIELEPEAAPATVTNFLTYVKENYYAGTIFHRVIQGFILQAGMGEDMKEKPGLHAPIFNEGKMALQAGLKNTTGSVAMARTENPQSAMAQFFVNMGDNGSSFDPNNKPGGDGAGYCVFGHVVEGMEVLVRMEKVQTVWRRGFPNVPEYPVRINKAELLPAEPAATPAAPAAPAPKP